MADHRVVVGLGNPGSRYEQTRHNAGFRVVALLARRLDAWGPASMCDAEVFEAQDPPLHWVLVRPLTYMNLSGRAVRCMVARLGIPASSVLVVYDDVALPVGQIRLRGRGSSGGHRGMQSVLEELGTLEVPRLRVGIGQPPTHLSWADYVLEVPSSAEQGRLREAEAVAVEAVLHWGRFGIDSAMSQFNRRSG
ncbi:MAG TPA: aminoacyl-tRNA hydrolase [Limnochordales bacterium]